MTHGANRDGVPVLLIEEDAVVAAAEAEAGACRFEFLHVAGAVGQVAIHAVENLQRGFAIDGAESARASGDQMTAMRWGVGGSVIYPGRTRAGWLRGECLRRAPARRGRDQSPPPCRA